MSGRTSAAVAGSSRAQGFDSVLCRAKNSVANFFCFRIIVASKFKKNNFMKFTVLTMIFSASLVAPLFADNMNSTNVLGDDRARASYALGMMLGHNFQQQGIDVDLDVLLRGLKDTESGGQTLLTTAEMQTTWRAFQKNLMAKQMKARAEAAQKNLAAGVAFLATNKDNPGVVALPDGLQYKVITKGTGPTPNPNDDVSVNYRGTLLDGTEFDSSAKTGRPANFNLSHIIPGWKEALGMMPVGSKWELYVPSALAYGERGNRDIPPNSTLIFDVELLATKSPPPPEAPLTSDIIKVPSADEMKKGAKIETLKAEDVQKMQTNSVPK
jgi:FKBP-type peptidyl-prolyl cis-trans isomerase FklB